MEQTRRRSDTKIQVHPILTQMQRERLKLKIAFLNVFFPLDNTFSPLPISPLYVLIT